MRAKYINESNLPYEKWELGVIKAWGDLLYLVYHNLDDHINKIVSFEETQNEFLNYFYNADEDEELRDWMANNPPTLNHGYALFDKLRLNKILNNIANKTLLKKDLIVYRFSNNYYKGWNSFTTNSTITSYKGKRGVFRLPKGFPVIFTYGYADHNEIILNLDNLKKYNE